MSTLNKQRTATLGELVTFRTGKLDSNAAVPNGLYPFFTCSQETLRTNTYSFDTECVLLAGNNANGIFPLKYFNGKFDAYQRTYIVKPRDQSVLTTKFLYYALRPKLSEFRSVSTGAATKFLTLTILNATEITLPPISAQRRVAEILSAYDDLIENNQRRIGLLEQMARAIYREWFVEFRCPGHEKVKFVDSALGKIPQGWEVTTLGAQLAALESGKRPKGGIRDVEDGVPSIGAENINGIGRHDFLGEKFVPREFFKEMRRGVVHDRDVAIYKDGAYIGKSSYFRDGFPHAECCVNEHVFLLRTNGIRLKQNALYLWLQEPDTVHTIRATNANAAQPGINQQTVGGLELILPDEKTASHFDQLVEPLLAELINLAKRIQNLRCTRDLLLPRLLSGQIDLSKVSREELLPV
jgi:type I restriction enzyme S subunit